MIKCENLRAGYGKREVLKGITWQAEPGLLTVIAGPNGCGKSTLLKAFMGQVRICGGEMFLKGKPISQWNPRERARCLAYVPQSRNDVNLSVSRMVLHGRFPHIVYPRRYTAKDQEIVEWAMEKMGILALKDCLISELSGGEKQKAYLAMALAQDAEVVLLDEPTTYLDLSYQLELMELLKELALEGRTVAAVLHDLGHGLQYADQILVMEDGQAAACGTPRQVLEGGMLEKVFRLKIYSTVNGQGEKHYWFEALKRQQPG